MDAREVLRRYLEQRRDMGERELVLDDLSVDEVMRMLGASSATTGREAPARASETGTDPDDWRSVLRAADASAPPEPRSAPRAPDAPRPPEPRSAPRPTADAPIGIVVGAAAADTVSIPLAALGTIDDVARAVAECRGCSLYKTARNPVPGEGSPTARLVCVGEAPGADEDASGRPFVGLSGQLLTKMLAAIQLAREDVFICNVLKHRPPGNRNPVPDEIRACSPFLIRQLELIRPSVIVAFGAFAAQTLLDSKQAIGKLRGFEHRYYGIPLVATYHPAALLRNSNWKRPAWDDVKLARRILDRAAGA